MTTIMAFFKNRTVQQLFTFAFFQNILWWVAGSTAATGTPLATDVKIYLGGYGMLLAAGYFLILKRRFQSHIGPILVVAAATLGFLAAPHDHLVQLFALLLCIFLVLACVPQLGLQSVYGLVVFSFLAGCGVPVILFFLRNHYLATQFLLPMIPLVASYLVFFEHSYLPAAQDWRWSLITPAVMLVTLLFLDFSWRVVIAAVLALAYWWLQPKINARYQLVTTSVIQLFLGLLLFK
ncbi:hypothetical protein [Levilactobacillus sp. HBUAS70063]|uniref:hypothetical protein n=1 Tax=Levilactobacillus sp. HBUAS70063 TaxID=3109359 RepID=UPI00313337E0